MNAPKSIHIFTSVVPKSVIGITFHPLMARVCAWHHDAEEGNVWCRRKGLPASHGLCGKCAKIQLAEIGDIVDSMKQVAID